MRRVRGQRLSSSCLQSAALLFLLLAGVGCRQDSLVFPRTVLIPADGRVQSVVGVHRRSGAALEASSLHALVPTLRFEQTSGGAVDLKLPAPVLPGVQIAPFAWGGRHWIVHVRYVPTSADSFGDGMPDALRLHSPEDRLAFRKWFTAIAEQEADLPAARVPTEIDDCAALLRFCYREALSRHDARWMDEQPEAEEFVQLSSIAQYRYPETPLGLNLFRVRPGPYAPGDNGNGAFAQFADAHALHALNAYFVSRNVREALPGDLLFYRQLEQNSPWHSMIVIGEPAEWVIYHTGPMGKAPGEIRRVMIADLLHHPDARWRPLPENTNFLGVYRWNILRDGS